MNLAALHEKLDRIAARLKEIEGRLGHVEYLLKPSIPTQFQKTEAKTRQRTPIELFRQLWRFHVHIPRYIWGPLAVILTVLGGIATYASLRFDVSVLPYTSLDPSDANATRFLITNQGPFNIYSVFYACKYVPMQTGPGPLIAYGTLVPYPVEKLHSHGNFSAFCQAPTGTGLPMPMKDGTLLDVEVMYIPPVFKWKMLRGGELFVLKYDHSGSAVWLPAGDMKPGADDLRKLACPRCQ